MKLPATSGKKARPPHERKGPTCGLKPGENQTTLGHMIKGKVRGPSPIVFASFPPPPPVDWDPTTREGTFAQCWRVR